MAASCNCGRAGLLAEERDPRRHIMAERSSEKLSLQWSILRHKLHNRCLNLGRAYFCAPFRPSLCMAA